MRLLNSGYMGVFPEDNISTKEFQKFLWIRIQSFSEFENSTIQYREKDYYRLLNEYIELTGKYYNLQKTIKEFINSHNKISKKFLHQVIWDVETFSMIENGRVYFANQLTEINEKRLGEIISYCEHEPFKHAFYISIMLSSYLQVIKDVGMNLEDYKSLQEKLLVINFFICLINGKYNNYIEYKIKNFQLPKILETSYYLRKKFVGIVKSNLEKYIKIDKNPPTILYGEQTGAQKFDANEIFSDISKSPISDNKKSNGCLYAFIIIAIILLIFLIISFISH